MRKARKQSKYFLIILTILILLGGGVAIGLNLPAMITFRNHTVDHFIAQAKAAKKEGERIKMFAYLKLAQDSSFGDHRAHTITANEQIQLGRYDLAINTLASSWSEPNYGYLGYLALKAQDNTKALAYFKIASHQQKTTKNLSGLGRALISLGKTKEGCEKIDEAIKNNLSDNEANAIAEICEHLLSNKKPSREIAYKQVEALMYTIGERTLLDVQNKIASDWLLLANISAARGDLGLASERIEHALTFDDVDPKIIKFAITIYQNQLEEKNSKEETDKLQSRLEQLNTKILHLPNY